MQNWKKTKILNTESIINAMRIIDQSVLQIGLIVDTNDNFIGTVTDGDIRRGILKGLPLEASIEEVTNKNPFIIKPSEVVKFMTNKNHQKYRHIPVVDNHKIVDLIVFDSTLSQEDKKNWVIIMAGGLGTRLGDLTKDKPKPMLEINDKPILELIIDNLIEAGFKKFYLSVNYRADVIIDYFGSGESKGITIKYIHESKKLGTAGCLSLFKESTEYPVLVINGDILTNINFANLLNYHSEHNAVASMAVRKYDFQVPYGVIKFEGHKLIELEEKPVQEFFVNAGIYVINPEAIQYVPENTHYDMPNLFNKLIKENQLCSIFPINEYWIDIGRVSDFQKAKIDHETNNLRDFKKRNE